MRGHLRRWLPPRGPSYELFDSSVFLFCIGIIGYVLTPPSGAQDEALYAPFKVLSGFSWSLGLSPQRMWGLLLAAAALAGIVLSFRDQTTRLGFGIVIVVTAYASTAFLVGLVLFGANPRAIISALLYGWIASGLFRAQRLYPFRRILWSDGGATDDD